MSVHWGGKGPGHVSRWPKAVGPVNTYSGATMLLDFLNPVLDPRITFSRGTNATLIDSTGKLTYAPANLLTFTEQFGNVIWTQANITRVDGVTDPNGGSNACRITATATNAVFQQVGATIAANAIGSFWVRRVSGTGTINLVAPNGGFSTALSVTSSWQRFSALELNRTGVVFAGIRITTSGDAVEIAFPQVEAVTYQTTPSTYVATTASAYYGPRFDYDPVTLAPRGLLIEEARTNTALYSDQFENAAWVKTATTVSANVTASPDGTTNADKLVETAVTSDHHIDQSVSFTTGTTYTFSFYAKAGERSVVAVRSASAWAADPRIRFTLSGSGTVTVDNGTPTGTITAVGNGWYRCTMTATTNATVSGVFRLSLYNGAYSYAGDGTSGLFLYGAQLEAGSFATSYIPTVASTVTRNADVATMTGTNFSTWYNQSEGTFVVGYDQLSAVNSDIFMAASAGPSFNPGSVGIFGTNTSIQGYVRASSAYTAQVTSTSPLGNNVPLVAGIAYRVDSVASCVNGTTLGTAPPPNAMPTTVVQLNIMSAGVTGVGKNGHIRTIAYFNTRLPNAQLQTLTAPSLATTLSLDFTSGSYNVGF